MNYFGRVKRGDEGGHCRDRAGPRHRVGQRNVLLFDQEDPQFLARPPVDFDGLLDAGAKPTECDECPSGEEDELPRGIAAAG